MKFLSTLLTLGGYILVYAAVAKHGRFATQPWMGVFRDAYGVDSKKKTDTGGPPTPGYGPNQGPFVRRRGAGPPSIGNGQPVGK